MKNWSESTAVNFLNKNGVEVRGKTIISRNGLKGLTSCSALDFLVNHCGYTSSL
jgi:hypothetical protein